MTSPLLEHLTVSDFRSIKGEVQAPLDANMVLLHGENGAGKTSMLSAIELALTGRVQSLLRADPAYEKQLLHRGALIDTPEEGRVSLRTKGLDNNAFGTSITSAGLTDGTFLGSADASFFAERCYLPQSMLGQLLQIYQDSDSSSESPLSRFVSDLLGLDRLDALEDGLTPTLDLRNLRKVTDTLGQTEAEKTRVDRSLADLRGSRRTCQEALTGAIEDLNVARAKFGFDQPVAENNLNEVAQQLSAVEDEASLAGLHDGRRRLDALMREEQRRRERLISNNEDVLRNESERASNALGAWRQSYVTRLNSIRETVARLFPEFNAPLSDPVRYYREAQTLAEAKGRDAALRAQQAERDVRRKGEILEEVSVTRTNLRTLEDELERISANSGVLATSLAEIAQFIEGDKCPVCERDFSELGKGTLSDRVSHRIRHLSGAAERLLGLSKSQVDARARLDRLEQENAEIEARGYLPEDADQWSRLSIELGSLSAELTWAVPVVTDGARLSQAALQTKRAQEALAGGDEALVQANADLREIASTLEIGLPSADQIDLFQWLGRTISEMVTALETRIEARRFAAAALTRCTGEIAKRRKLDTEIAAASAELRSFDGALDRASTVRTQAQTIRGKVEDVRSSIVRRVFNERLNKLWRDLFVRLTPNEPYIPAFSIPKERTHRLKPKLVTYHRSGAAGGTPGAMLSAGNLNTAALTLFIALHLTVKPRLPWLILDDPIQSMDDVHISQFAALLRTLAKEQGRQVFIAVHDRQLFEYLRLELSPAYQEDSLLTLELSRGASLDTRCIPTRIGYKEEVALRAA